MWLLVRVVALAALLGVGSCHDSTSTSQQTSGGSGGAVVATCGDGDCGSTESCDTCPDDCASCSDGGSGGSSAGAGGASGGPSLPEGGPIEGGTALVALGFGDASIVKGDVVLRFLPLADGAYERDSCRACAESHCSTYLVHCTTDTSCREVVDCLGACAPGDVGCLPGCAGDQANQIGVTLLAAYLDCLAVQCTALDGYQPLLDMPGDGRLASFRERVEEGAKECIPNPLYSTSAGYSPFCEEWTTAAGIAKCGDCTNGLCFRNCVLGTVPELSAEPAACALQTETCHPAGEYCNNDKDCCDARCSRGFCLQAGTVATLVDGDWDPMLHPNLPGTVALYEMPSVHLGQVGGPCTLDTFQCDEGLDCTSGGVCGLSIPVGSRPFSYWSFDHCTTLCASCDRPECLDRMDPAYRPSYEPTWRQICDAGVDCLATCDALLQSGLAVDGLLGASAYCSCKPACEGRTCGDGLCYEDVVNYECGVCDPGTVCDGMKCVPECEAGACGGDCGLCPAGQFCDATRHCVPASARPLRCTPRCEGRVCGYDGCGGSCGTCGTNDTCNPFGQCVQACAPVCENRQCGYDGCFGDCGTCGSGTTCRTDTQQCCPSTGCGPGCPCQYPLECYSLLGPPMCSADQSGDFINVDVPLPPPPTPTRPTVSPGGTAPKLGCNIVDCASVKAELEPGFFCDQDVDARFTNSCSFPVRCYYSFEYDGSIGLPLFEVVAPGTSVASQKSRSFRVADGNNRAHPSVHPWNRAGHSTKPREKDG